MLLNFLTVPMECFDLLTVLKMIAEYTREDYLCNKLKRHLENKWDVMYIANEGLAATCPEFKTWICEVGERFAKQNKGYFEWGNAWDCNQTQRLIELRNKIKELEVN